jgi:TPR repeat protein
VPELVALAVAKRGAMQALAAAGAPISAEEEESLRYVTQAATENADLLDSVLADLERSNPIRLVGTEETRPAGAGPEGQSGEDRGGAGDITEGLPLAPQPTSVTQTGPSREPEHGDTGQNRAVPAEAGARTPAPPRLDVLIRRGDEMVKLRDISAARLLYERAAAAGSKRAATAVGRTYDPEFLASIGVQGIRGSRIDADDWYRRAADLGEPEGRDRLALRSAQRSGQQPRKPDGR